MSALSIHQHIQHPGTGHVRTAGNEGRITLRAAHVVRMRDRTIFFSSPYCRRWYAVILVHESTLRCFLSGGGICFRQSLAKEGAGRSHVLHPLMKLDAFLMNELKIGTKFSCSIQHGYTLQLLQRTSIDKMAAPLKPLVLFIECCPCPSVNIYI